jgi:hypothetical protein
MLRKLSLAAAAAVSLGVAALAPTSASAWGGGWHGGWHPGWHGGFYHHYGYGPRFYVGGPALQLRLWRLLCPAAGSDSLGPPLAAGQPLLLILNPCSIRSETPAPRRGFCCAQGQAKRSRNFGENPIHPAAEAETISASAT